MSRVIDNLIAYRVLSMLVKPFKETDAYKLGIIDDEGKNLIKSSEFDSSEQRDAYTYLHRLVFNLKKMLNKLPGGESKFKSMVAALLLLKESYSSYTINVDEERFHKILDMLDDGLTLAEEEITVRDFMLMEDAPVNATGAMVATDQPKIKARKFAKFVVPDEVYNKFTGGKAKYRKWGNYLNLENEGERMIYDFAKKNPRGVIVLQNGQNTKAIRFNRRGGGSWSKLKRPTKQINNEIV